MHGYQRAIYDHQNFSRGKDPCPLPISGAAHAAVAVGHGDVHFYLDCR